MDFEKELKLLEKYIPEASKRNESVSKVDVGWHLDHSMKVLSGITQALGHSDPKVFRSTFNIQWQFIKLRGIPRGVGRAPKQVSPEKSKSIQELKSQLEQTRNTLKKLSNLHAKSHFEHPYFGNMDLKNTQKFMRMHTQHHLKIIDDILG
ncbi:MAG: DinB family protein [Bacteroidota bacterium]